MEKLVVRGMVVVALVSALVLLITMIAGATGQQHWKLDSESSSADYEMERVEGSGSDGQSGTPTIGGGSYKIWIADEAAATQVTFPGGKWIISLRTDTDWSDYLDIYVGKWSGSSFTAFGTTKKDEVSWSTGIITVHSQISSEYVPKDEWLALKICNLDSAGYTIHTTGDSELTSPYEDPGYPVPELAAGLLFGAGLLGLGGYMLVKRRRAAAEGDTVSGWQ